MTLSQRRYNYGGCGTWPTAMHTRIAAKGKGTEWPSLTVKSVESRQSSDTPTLGIDAGVPAEGPPMAGPGGLHTRRGQ